MVVYCILLTSGSRSRTYWLYHPQTVAQNSAQLAHSVRNTQHPLAYRQSADYERELQALSRVESKPFHIAFLRPYFHAPNNSKLERLSS